jgi:hypothetical protein
VLRERKPLGGPLLNKRKKKGELIESNKVGFISIDEYIATFHEEIQKYWKNYGQQ